jgi:hypothetical protein
VAEREASGDFDYLWADTDEREGVDGYAPDIDRPHEYIPQHTEPPRFDGFDGFD